MSTKELTFTEEMEQDIAERLGFEKSEWLGDWWLPGGNPQLTWAELIGWAIRILSAEATRWKEPGTTGSVSPTTSWHRRTRASPAPSFTGRSWRMTTTEEP